MIVIEHTEYCDRQRFWANWLLWCDSEELFRLSIGRA